MDRKSNFHLSFELFPPNTEEAKEKLRPTWLALKAWEPDFISVTFGAGGSNKGKSLNIIEHLTADHINTAPHLSGVGLTRETIAQLLEHHIKNKITHLVAIRGDLPTDLQGVHSDFHYANELVTFIRQLTGNHFNIKVAAYPEFHPEAKSPFSDLENFKKKVESGADSAITQFFFSADAYYRFLDNCQQYHIDIPIIPGIMPIADYPKLMRFAHICNAEIPLWLHKRLDAYRDSPSSVIDYGIEIISRLCDNLIQQKAPGLHFYTLNKLEPTQSVLKNLSLTSAI